MSDWKQAMRVFACLGINLFAVVWAGRAWFVNKDYLPAIIVAFAIVGTIWVLKKPVVEELYPYRNPRQR